MSSWRCQKPVRWLREGRKMVWWRRKTLKSKCAATQRWLNRLRDKTRHSRRKSNNNDPAPNMVKTTLTRLPFSHHSHHQCFCGCFGVSFKSITVHFQVHNQLECFDRVINSLNSHCDRHAGAPAINIRPIIVERSSNGSGRQQVVMVTAGRRDFLLVSSDESCVWHRSPRPNRILIRSL